MTLFLGKAEVKDVVRLFNCLATEGIDGGAWFQIRLSQVQGRRIEIEAIENDQIGAGKQFAVRGDRLEGMRIDPFRDDAGELNFVAGDVFHNAGDRRDSGDDVEFLFRRGGLLLFSAPDRQSKELREPKPPTKS